MADLEWYRSFVAVYRAGTVSGAARTRFLTQPAISQQLAALESAIGQRLFARTPRRMLPTDYAKELYGHVAASVDTLEQAPQHMTGALMSAQPLLRLGAPLEYFYETIIGKLINTSACLRVEFDIAATLAEKLKRAELDAVVATQQTPVSGIEYRKIDTEHFLLVGPAAARPPRREGGNAPAIVRAQTWLSAQRWISYGADLPIIRRYWQDVFKQRPAFQAAMVMPNLHAIARAVESGLGISVLPEYLCRAALKSKRLKVLWKSRHPVSNDLWIAYGKAARNNVEIIRLRQMLGTK